MYGTIRAGGAVVLASLLVWLGYPVESKLLQRSSLTQSRCLGSAACVTTYHNDNNRDGVNPHETQLVASSGSVSLHIIANVTLDGLAYAQPLYVSSLPIGSPAVGTNVVFVATENNSLYAVNADTGAVAWSVNLNRNGETAIPYTSLPVDPATGMPCNNLIPQVGITGTPVIDVAVESVPNSVGGERRLEAFYATCLTTC